MIKIGVFKIKKNHYRYLDRLLQEMPFAIQKQILKKHQKEDQLQSLIGRILLKKLLVDAGHPQTILEKIKLNNYNRPYINGVTDFSITHSGKYVICAVSKKTRLGVDIEKIKKIKIDDFNILLSKKELEKVQKQNTPLIAFFEVLTKKEAVGKANGKGLGALFPHIKIKKNMALCEKSWWNLMQLHIHHKYVSHVAFKGSNKIKIEELKIKDLLKISLSA